MYYYIRTTSIHISIERQQSTVPRISKIEFTCPSSHYKSSPTSFPRFRQYDYLSIKTTDLSRKQQEVCRDMEDARDNGENADFNDEKWWRSYHPSVTPFHQGSPSIRQTQADVQSHQ